MTAPNSDEAPVDGGEDTEAKKTPSIARQANHFRRGGIGLLIGASLIGYLQYVAADTDYQHAFFGCVGIGVITTLFVLYQFQRGCLKIGAPWRVPIVFGLTVLATVALVRVKSLSGEMIPQLAWRFSEESVPDLQEVEQEAVLEIAPVYWGQFLGNDRNGIVSTRQFALPSTSDEVSQLWSIGIGEGWASFAAAGSVAVTLEQRDGRECVTAYRISDGELLWLVDHESYHYHPLGQGGPRSTPTIVDERVYAQGATGQVWCLQLRTGEVIWQTDLLEVAGWDQAASEVPIPWGRSGSPLIVDGKCVLPLGGPDNGSQRALIALDTETGEVAWKSGIEQLSYASPQLLTLDGKQQIVSVNEANITGHDISSGERLWEIDWYGQTSTGANCASVIDAGDNRFLIGKGYGGGSALIEVRRDSESWQASDVWRSNRVLKTKFNHAVVRDGVAYALSNGALQAVQVESGERLWEQSRRGRFGQGQVILADDILIVQSEPGEVALVAADPNEYRELVRIPALNDKTWNAPTLVGNILLVRNGVQAMALQLPAKEIAEAEGPDDEGESNDKAVTKESSK